MKRNVSGWLFFVFVIFGTSVFAQTPAKLTGVVTDEKSMVLQSATIRLMRIADSSLVKTEITDKEGKFEFLFNEKGTFFIACSMQGHEPFNSESFEVTNGEDKQLKPVRLMTATVKLQGVTVNSKKPLIEVKADKTVFNVEASINATGSNAFELLQKSPGVQIDNNDNISLKGKTGVRVYVDGKMTQLDTKDLAAYLKSINSNDIEAIEMISNPSAKYDASGNAGIVNIRLKKNKKFGTNGSVNVGFVQGVTPKGNAALNLNYRDQKVNLFGNLSGNLGRNQNALNLYRIQNDTLYDQHTEMNSYDKSMNLKAGIDYFINRKHTIGFLATTNFADTRWESTGNTDIYYNPTGGTFVKRLEAYNSVPGSRTNANFNLNYRYADTSGTEINFDADYGLFTGVGRSYQPNYYYDKNGAILYTVVNRNYTPTDIDIYTAKVDVEHRLGKGKLGFGGKFSYVHTRNQFDFFVDDANGTPVIQPFQSNRFEYTENVNAAYLNYNRVLSAKWSIQAGLRMEQTNSDGILTRSDGIIQPDNEVVRHYLDFFPSAALTWNINQKHGLNLTYSRRIDRPTYQDLNPFENKLDELTYEKGNAFLRPQYTDNIELTHTFMGFINTTLGYSHVKDYATQATDTIGNATFVQQKNLASQDIYSINIGSPTPIKKWWNGYVSVWYNYQVFKGEIGDIAINNDISTYGAYLQQSFTLGKNYTAEISGWFNGPSVWGGTWKTSSQGAVDLGIQKVLFNNRATIKVSATDIFHTAPWSAVNDFGGLYVNGNGSWESQTFRVNFNWRFGSNQIKASRQRKTGLETESNRIKVGK